jgi:hypothetical protein
MYMNTDCRTSAAECLPSGVSGSLFQGFEKCFGAGIVPTVPPAAHALANRRTAFPQGIPKGLRAVLCAAPGTHEQAFPRRAVFKCHLQGGDRRSGMK